jgi:hypothetical protein
LAVAAEAVVVVEQVLAAVVLLAEAVQEVLLEQELFQHSNLTKQDYA